jgi:hypothetical protein
MASRAFWALRSARKSREDQPVLFMQGMRKVLPAAALGFIAASATAGPSLAESRTFVVNWFGGASYTQPENCPNGLNPSLDQEYAQELAGIGMPREQIEKLFRDKEKGGYGANLEFVVNQRGRINGKPVNPFSNPQAVPDIHLKSAVGKYAYGFNLDGQGAASPNSWEDPETHEKGVNNAFFRAVGCTEAFRGSLANQPTYWYWVWGQMRDNQPAWLVTIDGADLSKDGDVTVTFDRALEHMVIANNGEARQDMTYRIDPDPRSHNVYKAVMKNGIVTITDHGNFHILENPWGTPELDLHNFHMRLSMANDGTMSAIMGGYQSWHQLYFQLGNSGLDRESTTGSVPALYYQLKRFADAKPDPRTGENAEISIAYHLTAVSAFAVKPKDTTEIKKVASR